MSSRQAILHEIEIAPESVLREAYQFILRLKSRAGVEPKPGIHQAEHSKPDYLARQRTLFGDVVVPDSQPILDELRADRF
jgi:hypothetical protein